MGEKRQARPSRRAILAGIGVASGAGLLGEAIATPASAGVRPGISSVRATPAINPSGFGSISSAPQQNVSYQFRSFWDFSNADTLDAGRKWGGSGMYTPGSLDPLVATFDAPPGAVLHDVECYVSNTAATTWGVDVWAPGHGFAAMVTSGSIPAGTGAIKAHKFSIPSSGNGPYPAGTRIAPFIPTSTDGSVQINGVRLGFIHGGLNQVMRESPVRAYDSRSHSHLGGGTSRTVSLANWLPADAQGAVLALSVLNTHGSGVLQVSAAGSSSEAFAASWARTGDKSTNTLVSDVSLSRAVSVTSVHGSGQTDFVLDLIGWVV
jgi:hypothetical protein